MIDVRYKQRSKQAACSRTITVNRLSRRLRERYRKYAALFITGQVHVAKHSQRAGEAAEELHIAYPSSNPVVKECSNFLETTLQIFMNNRNSNSPITREVYECHVLTTFDT